MKPKETKPHVHGPMGPAEPLHRIRSEDQLDDVLSSPSDALVKFIANVQSTLLVLGAGGKMGPTLALMAKRAAAQAGHSLEVIAVSRFTDDPARRWLEDKGVKTISCDLLERDEVARLPASANIIYLAGLKFGTTQNPALTWAMNTIAPANVVQRYPASRIVALSTGNVYPLTAPERGGSREEDALTPVGEYPNAAVARERLFEFYATKHQTPVVLIRLFYAVELRYGVLVDIARKVLEGEPIDLANGYFNCIWQQDANDMIIRSLSLASMRSSSWNLCQPAIFGVRDIAADLGELLGTAPLFKSNSRDTALLGNPARICKALGAPPTAMDHVLHWTADWVKQGGRDLGRPTHFEVRDGLY